MPITHILAPQAPPSPASSTSSISIIGDWESEFETLETSDEPGPPKMEILPKHPVWIDTDGGTEDGWAILMALRAHKDPKVPFEIVGITCVHGITSTGNVAKNVRRLLQTARVSDIPIYHGSKTALVKPFQNLEDPPFNGYDGFGDSNLPNLDPELEEKCGVIAMIDAIQTHRRKLRILALGPLTNLALAVRLNDKIQDDVHSIHVVGGNLEGQGNATPAAEINFASDPEAAHIVITSFTCPIFILPWETSIRYGTSSHDWRIRALGGLNTKETRLMNIVEEQILKKYPDGWVATDALCVAITIEPRVVVRRKKFHCMVELQGSETRGMLVVDHNFRKSQPPNVILIQEVNLEVYEKLLIWAAGGPSDTK